MIGSESWKYVEQKSMVLLSISCFECLSRASPCFGGIGVETRRWLGSERGLLSALSLPSALTRAWRDCIVPAPTICSPCLQHHSNATNDNTKCLALQSHRPPQTSGENLMVPLEVVMRDFAHIAGALSNERSIWRGMCGRVSLSNHHQTTSCIHSPST